MTDIGTALANNGRKLGKYQGKDVLRTSVSIHNAGDGLSEALAIEPEELKINSTVFVVLECEVDAHDHKRMKKVPGAMELVQVLKAGTATLVDEALVRDLLDEQTKRIEDARESIREAEGVTRLPGTKDAALAKPAKKKTPAAKKAAAAK